MRFSYVILRYVHTYFCAVLQCSYSAYAPLHNKYFCHIKRNAHNVQCASRIMLNTINDLIDDHLNKSLLSNKRPSPPPPPPLRHAFKFLLDDPCLIHALHDSCSWSKIIQELAHCISFNAKLRKVRIMSSKLLSFKTTIWISKRSNLILSMDGLDSLLFVYCGCYVVYYVTHPGLIKTRLFTMGSPG